MAINKHTNWILSSLGLLSVAFSLVILFSTTVFAACSAEIQCDGSPLRCSCPREGTCTASSNCVTCSCGGQPAPLPTCCYGGGDS